MTRWSERCSRTLVRGGVLGGTSAMKRIGIGLIKLYRIVFAWLPPSCRFEPTCSHYTEQAIDEVRPAEGELDGRQAHRPMSPMEPGWV